MNVNTINSNTSTAARVRESGDAHWYSRDGIPRHSVFKADGKTLRPTTLADAKKLGLLPSVTTVLKLLAKPALTSWLIEQACLTIATAPRIENEPLDKFVERVLQTERQQDAEKNKAADRGTVLHAAASAKFTDGIVILPDEFKVYFDAVMALPLLKGKVLASEVVVVGNGWAGTTDLVIDSGDAVDVVDLKFAKTVPDKEPWKEHQLQLSAYARGIADGALAINLGDRRLRCWNVYGSTSQPGHAVALEVKDWERTYEEGFKPLVKHWQWANSHCLQ